ncbi:hypothetical protein E8E13_011248 [Curvularia kusanoi]|uniref:Uncharacterized protein n=1 Tax=Curvularia kusanoi TaxID=90978 RepID=A0A9P4TLJ5_CURKU|nr:hypothetical protein E8E13_011248 [Curvularia kusanoi]
MIHRRNVNILEFILHMRRWRLFPNPARVLDFDSDNVSWRQIIARLDELGIDFRKLDIKLYNELKSCETHEDLDIKLSSVQHMKESGVLELRYNNWRRHSEQMVYYELKLETEKRFPVSLNHMRFSHTFPLGIECNDARIAQLCDGPDPNAMPRVPRKEIHPWWAVHRMLRDFLKDLLRPVVKRYWTEPTAPARAWLHKWFMYPAWRYILWVLLVACPLLGFHMWYSMSENGCGTKCLDSA